MAPASQGSTSGAKQRQRVSRFSAGDRFARLGWAGVRALQASAGLTDAAGEDASGCFKEAADKRVPRAWHGEQEGWGFFLQERETLRWRAWLPAGAPPEPEMASGHFQVPCGFHNAAVIVSPLHARHIQPTLAGPARVPNVRVVEEIKSNRRPHPSPSALPSAYRQSPEARSSVMGRTRAAQLFQVR